MGDIIRVLVNAIHAKSGGGVTHLRNLLPRLADDRRLDLHVVLHADQLALFAPMDPRIRVHAVTFANGFLRRLLWEQAVLPGLARRLGADVVFSPANFGPLLLRRQVILLSNAVAVARSDRRLAKRLYWLALTLATLASVLRCRGIAAVSAYARDSLSFGLQRWLGGKMAVIHHGVSDQFSPDPAVPREGFLLAVSDVYVQKNLHTLVRALRLVRDRHPDIRLVVAGSRVDEDYYRRVAALVAELGLDQAVSFVGRLPPEELRPLYRRCLAFVFPSTAETFGLPLVEAMACGAPVACSNATAMPEIVGDAALLFDPSDPAAIAQALLRLMDSPALRVELSQAALRQAARFSWQRAARQTADLLIRAAGYTETE